MKTLNLLSLLLCLLLLTSSASAQSVSSNITKNVEASAAIVMLSSHRATIVSQLNTLKSRFTETHPTVVSKRSELEITQREMAKILAMPKSQQMLLNEAYGRLIVSKITTEAVLIDLIRDYTLSHPQLLKQANQLHEIEKELIQLLSR
jgi:uncharacterized protein involved in exopolysaccharide biosynthesis